MKKKVIIIAIAAAILAIAVVSAIVVAPMMSSAVLDTDVAYVTKISDINGSDIAFTSNRYNGVVETGEVVTVKADSDKIIKETFVKEGDTVKEGDKLFEYDVEHMKLQLSQSQLDLEQAKSVITNCNNQITTLEREKSTADQNLKLSIDSQILQNQIEVKRAEFTVSSTEEQIRKLNNAIENSVVKSEVDGKIQKITSLDMDYDIEGFATSNAYITIATTEDFRVKANISEENIDTFSIDAPVIVRSRKDESITWTGKVTSIDKSMPMSANNAIDTDSTTDSKYPVYVTLDNSDNLITGQHVTIELDTDKAEITDELSLDEFYICDIDTNPYVWCKSADDTLEKRSVVLGDYDQDSLTYVITDGLTSEDCIAYPEESLTEGMQTFEVPMFVSEEFEEMPSGVM